MEIKPDYSEVVSLEPGIYKARIIGVEARESQKGTRYLRWKMEVFGNEEKTALNGRAFYHNTMVSGPGAGNLRALLAAALGQYDGGGFDTDAVLGKTVKAVLVQGKNADGTASEFPEVKSISKLAE